MQSRSIPQNSNRNEELKRPFPVPRASGGVLPPPAPTKEGRPLQILEIQILVSDVSFFTKHFKLGSVEPSSETLFEFIPYTSNLGNNGKW